METWTIEVAEIAPKSGEQWRQTHGGRLVATALAQGASGYTWTAHTRGIELRLDFADEADWFRYRASDAVRAALDAAADPAAALLIYTGRCGLGDTRPAEPVLATVVVRYLRQWNRWSLRTFLKWWLTGEQGWWLAYQTDSTIDRLEWLTDHGLTVRGRSRRGGECYRLAPGVRPARVWRAVATGSIPPAADSDR